MAIAANVVYPPSGMLPMAASDARAMAASTLSTRRQRVPRVSTSRTCQAEAAGSRKTPTLTSRSLQCAHASGSQSSA